MCVCVCVREREGGGRENVSVPMRLCGLMHSGHGLVPAEYLPMMAKKPCHYSVL